MSKNEYLKQEIMEQSRHQFIYGYATDERKQFLSQLTQEYPVCVDTNSPMAILLDEIGLPKIPTNIEGLDKDLIEIVAREYLSFIIAYQIMVQARESVGFDLLDGRLERVFELLNYGSINFGHSLIGDSQDLISMLEVSKEYYREYYMKYLNTGEKFKLIDDIALPFLGIEMFVTQFKEALLNNSYFAVIIDKDHDIALPSTKAINGLVGSRINKDISMKVVIEPDAWDSYVDSSGQFVQESHDYGEVKLDDSLDEAISVKKKELYKV